MLMDTYHILRNSISFLQKMYDKPCYKTLSYDSIVKKKSISLRMYHTLVTDVKSTHHKNHQQCA